MAENLKENAPDLEAINSDDDGSTGDANNDSSSSQWHRGYIQGNTFENKEVKYMIINGKAVFEGDIILASTPKQIERLSQRLVKAVGIKTDENEKYRWPDKTASGEIPYRIDPGLPNPDRIIKAIQHWESNTRIRFLKWTESNADSYPNYLLFKKQGANEFPPCLSGIGMQDYWRFGVHEQEIFLQDGCPVSAVIHEIGHAVGLWHEQSRKDRDGWIKILKENIEKGAEDQFEQHGDDGDMIGPYDYCSIMHYRTNAFSKNGKPTIEVLKKDVKCLWDIGEAEKLSDGDIAAVNSMYENRPPITTVKQGDGSGERVAAAHAFRYEAPEATLYSSSRWEPNSNTWTPWKSFFEFQYNYDYKRGNSVLLFPLSGAWPAIGTTAGNKNLNFPCFWIDNKNTLNYISFPDRITGIVKDSNSSQFPGKLGDPVAAQNRDGDIEVFWVSNNDSRELRHIVFNIDSTGTKLSPGSPTSLGSGGKWSPNRRPVIAQNADGTLVAFMIGMDKKLYHISQNIVADNKPTVQWSGNWVQISEGNTRCFGDPVVTRNADGGLEVFVLFEWDKQVRLGSFWQYKDNGILRWSHLGPVGGVNRQWSPRKRPAVAPNPDGILEVFMIGMDKKLYHTWQMPRSRGRWHTDWHQFGEEEWPGGINPSIARTLDGRIELFLRSSDGKYYHRWQTSKNMPDSPPPWLWSNWTEMPKLEGQGENPIHQSS